MKRILVVDDQSDIRKLVRLTLHKRYEVLEASDAMEAYDSIHKNTPDCVILDVMMPGEMNGYQLCRKLRLEYGVNSFPIILLTARGHETERDHGMNAGADSYLVKPFSPLELTRQIDLFLERKP